MGYVVIEFISLGQNYIDFVPQSWLVGQCKQWPQCEPKVLKLMRERDIRIPDHMNFDLCRVQRIHKETGK